MATAAAAVLMVGLAGTVRIAGTLAVGDDDSAADVTAAAMDRIVDDARFADRVQINALRFRRPDDGGSRNVVYDNPPSGSDRRLRRSVDGGAYSDLLGSARLTFDAQIAGPGPGGPVVPGPAASVRGVWSDHDKDTDKFKIHYPSAHAGGRWAVLAMAYAVDGDYLYPWLPSGWSSQIDRTHTTGYFDDGDWRSLRLVVWVREIPPLGGFLSQDTDRKFEVTFRDDENEKEATDRVAAAMLIMESDDPYWPWDYAPHTRQRIGGETLIARRHSEIPDGAFNLQFWAHETWDGTSTPNPRFSGLVSLARAFRSEAGRGISLEVFGGQGPIADEIPNAHLVHTVPGGAGDLLIRSTLPMAAE